MLYRHVFDKISTEFRSISRVFVNFAAAYELRHLHFTNWRLKICIWRLYFSGWSPKGNLKIFLISSPVWFYFSGTVLCQIVFLHAFQSCLHSIISCLVLSCLPESHFYICLVTYITFCFE